MYVIKDMPDPVPQEDLDLLAAVETATVGHWRLFGFMERTIRPLLPKRRVVGTAVTIAIAGPDSTLLHHAAGMLRPGNIVVVDRLGDDRYACWGGGVTVAVKAAGAIAGIIDGPCTDAGEIEEVDFPIWCRGLSAITTRLYDLGGGMNIPISCGGAVVMPGDAILADESGVLVIPRDEVRAVAEKALAMQEAESNVVTKLKRQKLGELSGASAKIMAKVAGM